MRIADHRVPFTTDHSIDDRREALLSHRTWRWLAFRVPRPLVYWCVIRAGAHATSGEYGHEIVPEVTLMQVLERWSPVEET